jgi:hypothetical protein
MVLREVGQGSDCRRVYISPGGTADVKEVLKKASSSMHPKIPVGMISQCCIARRKRETRHHNKQGTSSKKRLLATRSSDESDGSRDTGST